MQTRQLGGQTAFMCVTYLVGKRDPKPLKRRTTRTMQANVKEHEGGNLAAFIPSGGKKATFENQ